jgi:hypothetical protein
LYWRSGGLTDHLQRQIESGQALESSVEYLVTAHDLSEALAQPFKLEWTINQNSTLHAEGRRILMQAPEALLLRGETITFDDFLVH